MEKINLLPVAEKIDDIYVYNDLPEKKDLRLDLPLAVYVLIFVGMLFGLSQSILIGVSIFGAMFIILPLDKKITLKCNGRVVRNTLWNRLPLLIFGLSLIVFCVTCLFSDKEETDTGATYHINDTGIMILKSYIAFLISIMIGRLIFLIVTAFAISSRKKRCTVPVSIEFVENRFYGETRVFTYYYEGEKYRFIDHEKQARIVYSSAEKAYKFTPDHIYIAPNEPECYYSRQIFGYNSKKLKHYFVSLLLLLLFTSVLWAPIVLKFLVDHICA